MRAPFCIKPNGVETRPPFFSVPGAPAAFSKVTQGGQGLGRLGERARGETLHSYRTNAPLLKSKRPSHSSPCTARPPGVDAANIHAQQYSPWQCMPSRARPPVQRQAVGFGRHAIVACARSSRTTMTPRDPLSDVEKGGVGLDTVAPPSLSSKKEACSAWVHTSFVSSPWIFDRPS